MNVIKNIVGKRLIKDGVMVEWVPHTEIGKRGDRADSPDEGEMLRFDVSRITDNGAEKVSDSFYCTQVPAATDQAELQRLLEIMVDQVHDAVKTGKSIKQICEELSGIEPGYGQGV